MEILFTPALASIALIMTIMARDQFTFREQKPMLEQIEPFVFKTNADSNVGDGK